MKAITCLIVGGFPCEALWMPKTLPGILKHLPGDNPELLVVDSSATPEGRRIAAMALDFDYPRTIVIPSGGAVRETPKVLLDTGVWPARLRDHGGAYDAALAWCRAHRYEAMWSVELDCAASGPWQQELLAAVQDGALMAGGFKFAYGPLHHVPACYRTGVAWPSFSTRPKGADRQHPRYAELNDDSKTSPWHQSDWDVQQAAWFWAACQDRAVHVPTPNLHHHWKGIQRGPSEELPERQTLLDRLFGKYGSDKTRAHGFGRWYSMLFEHRRADVRKVLEVGIYRGGSIRAWRDYFPNAEIVAVDVLPERCEAVRSIPGVRAFACDQQDAAGLAAVLKETGGGFDLVVDDDGHAFHPQVVCFEVLWPAVKPGGVYVIEDLCFAFKGGALQQPSIAAWLWAKVQESVKQSSAAPRPGFLFGNDACFLVKP